MPIVVTLDVALARRKMKARALAAEMGIAEQVERRARSAHRVLRLQGNPLL